VFLAALRVPDGVLPDARDRAALQRIEQLLRRKPGRDRIDQDGLFDAIERLLTPATPAEYRPVTRRTSPRHPRRCCRDLDYRATILNTA
jgi:hypothetical protein